MTLELVRSEISDHRVAVAVRVSGASIRVAAVQAGLRFDVPGLTYLGLQVPARPLGLSVAHAIAPGRLRVAAIAPGGFDSNSLVALFEVHDVTALERLRVEPGSAAVFTEARTLVPFRLQSAGPMVDTELEVGTVEGLDAAAWAMRLGWSAAPGSARLASVVAGDPVYGDVDFSGSLDVNDALEVALAVVELRPALTGDTLEVANVVPANTEDGVEATLPDVCRPGRGCTAEAPFVVTAPGAADINDALVIAQVVVGMPRPVVGKPVPPPPLPGPTVRLTRLLPGFFLSSAYAINDAGAVVGIVDRNYGYIFSDAFMAGAKPMTWPAGGNVTLLERPSPLPPGEVDFPPQNAGSEAIGINNAGLILVKVAYPFVSYLVSGASSAFIRTDVHPRSASNDLFAAPSRVMNDAGEFIAACRPTPDAPIENAACVVNVITGAQRLLPEMADKVGMQADAQYGINNQGDAVGQYIVRDGSQARSRGLVWLHSQAARALPPLPGDNCSAGWGINSARDVVGVSGRCTVSPFVVTGEIDTSYFSNPTGISGARPAMWRAADGYLSQALPLPPGGQTFAAAFGINDRGVVIGGLVRSTGSVPVFWVDEVPYSFEAVGGLQGCTDSSGFGPSGYAIAINEMNQIAGECRLKAAVWEITLPSPAPVSREPVASAIRR